MKTRRKLLLVVLVLAACLQAFAQNGAGGGWQQRMRSEKIAYLTAEIGLTPDEAQKFWPIYNQAEKERMTSMDAVRKAFRELDGAVKAGKSEQEIAKLLRAYADAMKTSDNVNAKYIASYEKVLSATKVAKLFLAEESFRNLQIHRLQGGGWNAGGSGRTERQSREKTP